MRDTTSTRHGIHPIGPMRLAESERNAPNATGRGDGRRDCSGFAVFAHGDLGAMHVFAHEAFDDGDIDNGYRVLGRWLATHSGSGSDWVHLQFHMAVFELARGGHDAAFERFMTEILPVAAATPLALTDAPSLLWRLEMVLPDDRSLPWQALRPMAEQMIDAVEDPFTVLHQLMVFAGTGDDAAIAAWQTQRRRRFASGRDELLLEASRAFACIARSEHATAARKLRRLRPKLKLIGGSHAQNDLFDQLERWCTQHQRSSNALPLLRRAA